MEAKKVRKQSVSWKIKKTTTGEIRKWTSSVNWGGELSFDLISCCFSKLGVVGAGIIRRETCHHFPVFFLQFYHRNWKEGSERDISELSWKTQNFSSSSSYLFTLRSGKPSPHPFLVANETGSLFETRLEEVAVPFTFRRLGIPRFPSTHEAPPVRPV